MRAEKLYSLAVWIFCHKSPRQRSFCRGVTWCRGWACCRSWTGMVQDRMLCGWPIVGRGWWTGSATVHGLDEPRIDL